MLAPGVIVSGGTVARSIVSPGVTVRSTSLVEDSVLMGNVNVGRGAVLRRAIVDKNVVIPDGVQIGVDHEHDRARGFSVSPGGVVVVGKGQKVAP
jgi:glucose-1-phosphate adenylyltransferase